MSKFDDWFIAPSLRQLFKDVNAWAPGRSTRSDGGIGNKAHSARLSDHNPDWLAKGRRRGVVRAIDITVLDAKGRRQFDPDVVLRALFKDRRVRYVIWDSGIYRRKNGFRRESYAKVNPLGYLRNKHDHHIHVSIEQNEAAEFDTSSWGLLAVEGNTTPVVTVRPQVQENDMKLFFVPTTKVHYVADASGKRRVRDSDVDEWKNALGEPKVISATALDILPDLDRSPINRAE